MDKKLKNMLRRVRSIAGRCSRMLHGLSREQRARIGYYAALVAILALLGGASYAYRVREANPVPEKLPAYTTTLAQAVAEPSPLPTPAPARWVWPLEGEIIGEYAPDTTVWSATLEQWQTHPAVDIAGNPGEAVVACADGTVTDAWRDVLWGNVIQIVHSEGFTSTYANLNTLNLVEIGQSVTAGEVISAVGQSADCEAGMPWHLHFSVERDGEPVDFASLVGQMGD